MSTSYRTLTPDEWLSKAESFLMGESKAYRYAHGPGREVFIRTRQQMDNSIKWIVSMDNFCLGKDGRFHYEMLPSSRTDKFIETTRFESKEEAYNAWVIHENTVKDKTLYCDRI